VPALDDFGGMLDWSRLAGWIQDAGLPGSGPVVAVVRLTGGAQNLLYALGRADGTELVLRRPGRHARADSADGMLREMRVLAALAGTRVPHPTLYASCTDTSVIGVPFSILEKVDGFTPVGQLPGRYGDDPRWRRVAALELAEAAGRLAMVAPAEVGLADFGRPEGWLERQVPRYRRMLEDYRQTDDYRAAESPHVDTIADWLDAHRPAAARIGIVHGDLQFANIMLRHDSPGLAAIVDWEMASQGDPLLDLGWILTAWREQGDPPGSEPYLQPWAGMPTRRDMVDHYAGTTGRDITAFPWFFVLACFRLAALLEGSFVRALNGKMDAATGQTLHAYARWLWEKAAQETS
jgi:aminoglycoside phosphotransferase (APT) family kinase protein